jgi:hypothetical protein
MPSYCNAHKFSNTGYQKQHIISQTERCYSNDHWRKAIDLDTNRKEDVISSIRSDFMVVSKQQKEFTPSSELKQIEILMNIFESRLLNFQQIVPKIAEEAF